MIREKNFNSQFSKDAELDKIKFDFVEVSKKGCSKDIHTQNIFSFDIECSSGYMDPKDNIIKGYSPKKAENNPERYELAEKHSLQYVNQMGATSKGNAVKGDEPFVFGHRYLHEWKEFMEKLSDRIFYFAITRAKKYDDYSCQKLKEVPRKQKVKAICYIHNESYEYQFLRNILEKEFSCIRGGKRGAVFARTKRTPMKFTVTIGKVIWEFRDSYVLTGESLKAWTKNLSVKKLEEPGWFYTPVLTPETPLSPERIDYSINDVLSMLHGIDKIKKDFDDIFNLPLTQTGFIRRQAEKLAFMDPAWSVVCKDVLDKLTYEMYFDLIDLFAGGWTHASSAYSSTVLGVKGLQAPGGGVNAVDFASSYPACMTTKTYPVTAFELCDESEYDWLLSLDLEDPEIPFHYWLEFECENVDSKTINTFWSSSKVIKYEGILYDNGKIAGADYLRLKLTDLDFAVFKRCYNFENLKIIRMYKSEAAHLPKDFIMMILKWYGNKTSFKNVEGKEDEYDSAKRDVNGAYGMMVLKSFSDEILFGYNEEDDEIEWFSKDLDEAGFYEKKEEELKRPIWNSYQLGVWVTAWGRYCLVGKVLMGLGMKSRGLDCLAAYGDTDSCKGLFAKDDPTVTEYNENMLKQHEYVANKYGFDVNLFRPKDPKGIERPLGILADDGHYETAKFLRAKAYAVTEYDKKGNLVLEATIAGLPKAAGAEKLTEMSMKKYGRLTADILDNDIEWTPAESGKLVTYYLDSQVPCVWKDMNGELYGSDEKFGIVLMPTSFNLSLTDDYEMLIEAIQGGLEADCFEDMTKAYARYILNDRDLKTKLVYNDKRNKKKNK